MNAVHSLSPRERQALSVMATGVQFKVGARQLGVSYWTMKDHIASARKKLGARTTAQAVAVAARTGEIDMRPLPDLTNVDAMAAKGRRSALMTARNEAAEELRNVMVAVQSADPATLAEFEKPLYDIAARLGEIAKLWEKL